MNKAKKKKYNLLEPDEMYTYSKEISAQLLIIYKSNPKVVEMLPLILMYSSAQLTKYLIQEGYYDGAMMRLEGALKDAADMYRSQEKRKSDESGN